MYLVNLIMSLKTSVLWNVTPCSLGDDYQYSECTCCLHHHGWKMNQVQTNRYGCRERKDLSPVLRPQFCRYITCFQVQPTLLPWRLSQRVPPICWLPSTRIHSVTPWEIITLSQHWEDLKSRIKVLVCENYFLSQGVWVAIQCECLCHLASSIPTNSFAKSRLHA